MKQLKTIIIFIILIAGLLAGPVSIKFLLAAPQTDEISRLETEAAVLESRLAKLKTAIDNCRRSISPQSPNCFIEISWMQARVSYLDAEKIAETLEEQVREIRRRIDYLKSQQNQPASPPVNTAPVSPVTPSVSSPPVTTNPPANQQSQQNQQNQISPVNPPQPSSSLPARGKIGGLSQSEWNRLMSLQERLEGLYQTYGVVDQAEADELRSEIYRLWQKAVSGPLTREQRKMLRIRLPSQSPASGPVRSIREELEEKSNRLKPSPPPSPLSVATSLVESHIETGAQQAVDEFGKDWAEVVNVKQVDRRLLNYENVVGVSRITMKLKEKDYPGAIAETVDFIAGKVMLPLTSMNVSVFKSVYGQITFGALNKFMEDSMKMTGADFSYKEMTKDMNLGQKAVTEWLGVGELMREKDKEREKR